MNPEITFWHEMLYSSTRSGWCGLLILLMFAVMYLSTLWQVVRRRPERVLQNVVINVFTLAAFNLHGVYYEFYMLQHAASGASQASLLWWSSYLRLKLSLPLACSLPLVALLGILARPKGAILCNPGCFPGALISLAGAIALDLFVLTSVFGSAVIQDGKEIGRLYDRLHKERRERVAEPAMPSYSVPATRSPQG